MIADQNGPTTINGTQCNEIARRVFHKAAGKAEVEIAKQQPDTEFIIALAQLMEACANDFEAEDSE